MKVLVTGHQGYIGVILTPMLQAAGHEVVGLDTDLYERCTFGDGMPDVPSMRKDLRDVEQADLTGFDAVIHLAALSNDPLGNINPSLTYDINHLASVRLAKLANYLDGDRFFVAYGEAVANIDLDALVHFHQQHGQMATITGIKFRSQYGKVEANAQGQITEFVEKPTLPYWINGGFMLFETAVLDLIHADNRENLDLERDIMPHLAQQQQLMLYQHDGYWQSMKTLKDAITLKEAWQTERPWQVW